MIERERISHSVFLIKTGEHGLPGRTDLETGTHQNQSCVSFGVTFMRILKEMATRFNIYFGDDEEGLLREGKAEIENLSAFFKDALKKRLKESKKTEEQGINSQKIFDRKFADFQTEADIRKVFETKDAAKPALKNRLAELKRAHPKEFEQLKDQFKKRYPAYAKLTEEL